MSFSIIFIAEVIKHWFLFHRKEEINDLRRSLYKGWKGRKSKEEIEIDEMAMKEMKFIYSTFYLTYILGMPAGLFAFYVKSDGFPFPMRLPLRIDYTDLTQFNIAFLIGAVFSALWLLFVIEEEVSMFSLLIQITGEYRILMHRINKLNYLIGVFPENDDVKNKKMYLEVNPVLKQARNRAYAKELLRQQQQIVRQVNLYYYYYIKLILFILQTVKKHGGFDIKRKWTLFN